MRSKLLKKLGIFLVINLLFSCHNSLNKNTISSAENPSNNQQKIVEKSDIVRQEDRKILKTILDQKNLTQQMNQWQGKLLIIPVNQEQKPEKITHYHYNSVYQDSNNNNIQDSKDQGFFNPASTVKVGISALVLEKLQQYNFNKDTQYRRAGTSQWYSISEDIKQALVISDNQATNRLILFLGFDYLNQQMRNKAIPYFTVNRLMLNQGVSTNSPAIELKFQGKIIKQPPQIVAKKFPCWETGKKSGNCAIAQDLAEILMRIVQPQIFPPSQQFNIGEKDRKWLENIMSKTPKQADFNYPNTYCRFLDPLAQKIAHQRGRLLNKCGIGLFSHTFVDTSFLETDQGDKFYIVFALTPPENVSQTQVVVWMNQVIAKILPEFKKISE